MSLSIRFFRDGEEIAKVPSAWQLDVTMRLAQRTASQYRATFFRVCDEDAGGIELDSGIIYEQ
jgi:hypothetical protein